MLCDVSDVACIGFTCPGDGLYPYPTNCTLYYQCYSGQYTVMTCPPPLIFDNSLKTCNWASQTYCPVTDGTTQSPVPSNTTQTMTTWASTNNNASCKYCSLLLHSL